MSETLGHFSARIHAQHLRPLDTGDETERGRRDWKHHPQRDMTPKPKRRLQLAAAVQTFKIFLKTEKLVLFCQINLNKSAFPRPSGSSGSSRMTKEMRLIFEKGKWNDKRDTRRLRRLRADCIFLCFLHCMQKKRRFCAAKMHSVEPQRSRATYAQTKTKSHSLRNDFFALVEISKDRTADLMTASCYRFVIWSIFASNTSVLSTKSAGFCRRFIHCVHTFSRTLGSQSGSGQSGEFGEVLSEWMWIVT
ncbi:MAG: hypothetical protein ACLS3C_07070 [Oscillospiraceae bacterium]